MASIGAQREYYQDQLQERGYVSVAFGISGADIDPLFTQFREFLDLCSQPGGQQFSDALAYKPIDRSAGADGFMLRRRVGEVNPFSINPIPSTEDKDVAHIFPASIVRAEAYLGRFGLPAIMRKFLGSSIELHEAAKSCVRPVFKALGFEEALLAADKLDDQHVVRLLRYLGTSAALKAGLHFDRSWATLAAWESHPGLVGAPGNNAQRKSLDITGLEEMATNALATPIAHRTGSAKLFLGAGYNRAPDDLYKQSGQLPLLLHGVRNEQPREERDAVVVFIHPPAGFPDYVVPGIGETGIEDIRDHILRRKPVHEEVA